MNFKLINKKTNNIICEIKINAFLATKREFHISFNKQIQLLDFNTIYDDNCELIINLDNTNILSGKLKELRYDFKKIRNEKKFHFVFIINSED